MLAIDHVVAITPDFERTVGKLQAAGLDLRRVREEPTPAGAPRQAFFRLGSEILELVAEPAEVTARSGGPDRPAIFWGLALLTADIERTAAAFSPHVGEPRAAVQPGRRIATGQALRGAVRPDCPDHTTREGGTDMSEELWMDVDRFIDEHLVGPDPVLERALSESAAAGLPAIAVSPAQGEILHLLARIHGARRILELGTLGAYSTIWMARALPPAGG